MDPYQKYEKLTDKIGKLKKNCERYVLHSICDVMGGIAIPFGMMYATYINGGNAEEVLCLGLLPGGVLMLLGILEGINYADKTEKCELKISELEKQLGENQPLLR